MFADFRNDLALFESLMRPKVDPVDLFEASRRPSADADTDGEGDGGGEGETESISNKLIGSVLTQAIQAELKQHKSLYKKLFYLTAQPEKTEDFTLGSVSFGNKTYTIKTKKDLINSPWFSIEGNTIYLGLSPLIRARLDGKRGNGLNNLLKKYDVNTLINAENLLYRKTVNSVVNQLGKKLDETGNDTLGKSTPPTEGNKQDQNGQQDKNGQPDDNKPITTEKPGDDNAPDTPNEVNQKKLGNEIISDFKEHYLDELESEVNSTAKQQGEVGDEDKNAITDKYLEAVMEDYPDADDNTKDRVRSVIELYVDKFANPNGQQNQQNQQDKDPGDDDMNWGPKDKEKDGDGDDDEGDKDNQKKNTGRSDGLSHIHGWLHDTMNAWANQGVINNNLHHYTGNNTSYNSKKEQPKKKSAQEIREKAKQKKASGQKSDNFFKEG